MQGVTVDEENQPKSRNDEDFMNLRPSPNFKHKKYLRSKFEEAMMIEANSTSLGHNKHNKLEKVNITMVSSAAAQPPLPPNPPPPDTPPMIINLKQEIEDDEYSSTNIEPITDFNQPDGAATATIKTDLSEKATMCRNFARGTCRKGTACRFVHELILSQLPGVYTFCRNFQNSVCSFPKCKFVHATVFEKEHFFRTGFLPPHTLAHLAEPSVLQPPPPPPQSEEASVEQPAEVAIEQPPVYSNAPPPPSSISCIETVVRYNTENSVERSEPNIFSTVQVTSTTSPKHDWSDIDDDTSSSSRDFDTGEALPRKCKNCPRTEIREQLLKNKIERRVRINKKISQKIARLDKSNAVLAAVLGAVFKPGQLGGTAGFNSPDKELMGLLPNSKLTAVLAKLLRNVEMPRPDSS